MTSNPKTPRAQAEVAPTTYEKVQNQRRIKSAQVRDLCGAVSDMTLWRWTQDRNFPRPIYIAHRRYWLEAEVIVWLDAQAEQAA